MPTIEVYQIIVPLVSLGFISSSIFHYRRGEVGLPELLLWFLFWTSLALVAIMPDIITNFVANLLGFKSNVNAFIFMSLGVLFYFNFRTAFAVNKLNRKLTELVRKNAIENAQKKK